MKHCSISFEKGKECLFNKRVTQKIYCSTPTPLLFHCVLLPVWKEEGVGRSRKEKGGKDWKKERKGKKGRAKEGQERTRKEKKEEERTRKNKKEQERTRMERDGKGWKGMGNEDEGWKWREKDGE